MIHNLRKQHHYQRKFNSQIYIPQWTAQSHKNSGISSASSKFAKCYGELTLSGQQYCLSEEYTVQQNSNRGSEAISNSSKGIKLELTGWRLEVDHVAIAMERSKMLVNFETTATLQVKNWYQHQCKIGNSCGGTAPFQPQRQLLLAKYRLITSLFSCRDQLI